ncbi:peptidase S8 and S53, subtilisin, kexin, sedolisin [Salinispora tropica CNB-440]|uniref:Peptidase S8 and S53, subtilisin, kexin, sedolisin n=1 Tax=Salinispora tropica (strain ATCC BAA-916 / DSM 44818 / JCM 13857 / NBRC 105044 / CNB-440) TaxID=369723 RepID=A4XB86_SALTO|nr:peptidase S8 and S53, subtilisin, kexin, sedolisin [Salinispora tropica CNB-440]
MERYLPAAGACAGNDILPFVNATPVDVTLDEEAPLHRRRTTAVIGLVLTLALTAPTAASAAPTAASAATAGAPKVEPNRLHTVTLITGDRVTVTAAGNTEVRPGPDRKDMRFLIDHERGGQLSVVPQDAVALIQAGRVDRRLFDITGLIDAGYDDARRDTLPLLVSYSGEPGSRGAGVSAGVRVTRDLPAINGAAVTAGKSDVAAVWSALNVGATDVRFGAEEGVERLWLDGRRTITLDHSVSQIGAPTAWSAGLTGTGVTVAVLDTGVDATHPDLIGKIAEARNFTETPDAHDTVGHGTHVASTIAGSGVASDGRYQGVAPDATLLDGKVCQDVGCPESAILAGMQWAAVDKRADVVNMSLGGWDSPEIDPLEEAVGALTAQTGALFVVSAGNAGGDGTVGSPASADAALAVGAVDREDELADFSSRGPRAGDDALKPDITAPGVDIVAARSAHGRIGEPVGEHYARLSGTSMAAPHVAGAAALLAQQHPDWTAEQLKSTLMAAARPHPAQTAYQQGAGRVDLTRAIGQTVTSDPVSVSFGLVRWPHDDDQPVTRAVSWRNSGSSLVALDLTVEAAGPGGRAAPVGMFILGTDRVTIPAGGRAETTVTVDTRLGDVDGYWTGRVVARSGDIVSVTPLAVNREVESYDLTLTHRDRAGAATAEYWTNLVGLDSLGLWSAYDADGTVEVRLPKGRYGLKSTIFEPAGEGPVGVTDLVAPELVIDRERDITVDARTAKPIRVTVPRRDATPAVVGIGSSFYSADGDSYNLFLRADDFDDITIGQIGNGSFSDEIFIATISSQWADLEAAHSPYLYALSETIPGRAPTGFVREYHKRDLATVKHRFHGGYEGMAAERYVLATLEQPIFGAFVRLPTTVPGQRVEYYNTRGVRWSGVINFAAPDLTLAWQEPTAWLVSEPTAYRAGRTTRETWNQAPHGPSFPVQTVSDPGDFIHVSRLGDTIHAGIPVFSDATGHRGNSLEETERMRLWRDGKLVGESEVARLGEFPVPPAEADYRLTVEATRGFTDLSTEVESTWTFRSKHETGPEPVRLPLSSIRFNPPLAADNSARAGRLLRIPVEMRRQSGAGTATVAKLTVDASYDGGKTWRTVPVRRTGDGWTALVRHPDTPGHVSLRAHARDTDGNTVSTRILQAYRLK